MAIDPAFDSYRATALGSPNLAPDASPPAEHEGPIDTLSRLNNVPARWPAESFEKLHNGMQALYFSGLPYEGKPTRVFAIVGLPDGVRNPPGVVLVHGGGGTAFVEWVRRWMEQGFAAIAIATEGQTDTPSEGGRWQRHEHSGPTSFGIYQDGAKPIEAQWMYHAVGATILARNLLRSMTDSRRVGVCGVSWGSIVAMTAAGFNLDWQFLIAGYGSGQLHTQENRYKVAGEFAAYRDVWEPSQRLWRFKGPSLWMNWTGDLHFDLAAQAATYGKVAGPRLVALRPQWDHSHQAIWTAPESYAFARDVINRQPLPEVRASTEAGHATMRGMTSRRIQSAELCWTTDKGFTGDRAWRTAPASVVQDVAGAFDIEAALPDGVTGWFITADADGLKISSDYQPA